MAGGRVPGSLGNGDGGKVVNSPDPLGTSADASQVSYEVFKRAGLERQIRNASRGGQNYNPPVADSELEVIEGVHRMRREAAQRCKDLLAAARSALSAAQSAHDPGGSCNSDWDRLLLPRLRLRRRPMGTLLPRLLPRD